MSSTSFAKRLSLLFFLFSSSVSALNITEILSKYPEFSTFSNLLGQTKVADTINSRQTITVLVVNNAAFSSVSGQPDNVVKNILGLHVILDYFDKQKLEKLDKKTALLTTLFQSSGQAKDQQGFLNVTVLSDGSIAFGSAVSGAEHKANLVKSVTSQPYNISILQVSSIIAPPGMAGGSNTNSTNETTPSPSGSPTKTPAPGKAPTPSASRKSSLSKVRTPSKANSPEASSPTGADGPASADSPTNVAPSDGTSPKGSPPEPAAGGASGPAADGPAADSASDGSTVTPIGGFKLGVLAVIFSSTWSLF